MHLFYCKTCGNVVASEATETSDQHVAIESNATKERKCQAAVVGRMPFTKTCGGTLAPVIRRDR